MSFIFSFSPLTLVFLHQSFIGVARYMYTVTKLFLESRRVVLSCHSKEYVVCMLYKIVRNCMYSSEQI